MLSEDAPVEIIDPDEVRVIAAHLLAQDDTSVHNKAKYILDGPEDINGKQLVDMIEKYTGAAVKDVRYKDVRYKDVRYKDVSFIDKVYEYQYAATKQSKNVIYSIKRAPETMWEGKCSSSTTSKEILELAAPKRTPVDILDAILKEEGNR
jgi:hypothetical protein